MNEVLLLSIIFGGAYNAFCLILTTDKERQSWSNKRIFWHVVLSGPLIWIVAALLCVFFWSQSKIKSKFN